MACPLLDTFSWRVARTRALLTVPLLQIVTRTVTLRGLRIFDSLASVVPAKAGTHTPCPRDVAKRTTRLQRNGLWVPAFAGTTGIGGSRDSLRLRCSLHWASL